LFDGLPSKPFGVKAKSNSGTHYARTSAGRVIPPSPRLCELKEF